MGHGTRSEPTLAPYCARRPPAGPQQDAREKTRGQTRKVTIPEKTTIYLVQSNIPLGLQLRHSTNFALIGNADLVRKFGLNIWPI